MIYVDLNTRGRASVMSSLFLSYHVTIVDLKMVGSAAVAFPGCINGDKPAIGNVFRIFFNSEAEKAAFSDYLKNAVEKYGAVIQSEGKVPADHGFITYKRIRLKGAKRTAASLLALAKKWAPVNGLTIEDQLNRLREHKSAKKEMPYIVTASFSNRNTFKLFIDAVVVDCAQSGEFSAYGLSQCGATVPHF